MATNETISNIKCSKKYRGGNTCAAVNCHNWTCNTLQNSGFSGYFGVFYELGQYDLTYTLWDHSASMKHSMGPACVGYTPGPPENQIPP